MLNRLPSNDASMLASPPYAADLIMKPSYPGVVLTEKTEGTLIFDDRSGNTASKSSRRRQRRMVPEKSKDDAYWLRRTKNNEAAKISRQKRRLCDWALRMQLQALIKENADLRSDLNTLWHRFDRTQQSYMELLGKHTQSTRDMALFKSILTHTSLSQERKVDSIESFSTNATHSCGFPTRGTIPTFYSDSKIPSGIFHNAEQLTAIPTSFTDANWLTSQNVTSSHVGNFSNPNSCGDIFNVPIAKPQSTSFTLDKTNPYHTNVEVTKSCEAKPMTSNRGFVISGTGLKSKFTEDENVANLEELQKNRRAISGDGKALAMQEGTPLIKFQADRKPVNDMHKSEFNVMMTSVLSHDDVRGHRTDGQMQCRGHYHPTEQVICEKHGRGERSLPLKLRRKQQRTAEAGSQTGDGSDSRISKVSTFRYAERSSLNTTEDRVDYTPSDFLPVDLSIRN